MNTSKLTSFFCILLVILMSCDEGELIEKEDPREFDSVYVLDTIPKIDSLECDTIFSCTLSRAAELIYDKLLEAYEKDDALALQSILNNWNNRYDPNVSINDSLIEVYAVYKEFYSPWDLDRIVDSEFGPEIYLGIEYYIIQAEIRYNYAFGSDDYETSSIQKFRPTINNGKISLLYLSEEYKTAINCFLGAGNEPYDMCYHLHPPFPPAEINLRASFLGKYLQFFHGHWGNYWHLETHPEVDRISFNETKDSAQVYFRIGYQGGEAILEKDENGWNIVDHYMTWIE